MKFLLLTLLFFLYVLTAKAQTSLGFDILSIDNGFSSSRANAIIQDRAGFMWIGTWNGLNRYDGYECQVFQPGNRDSTSISNIEVTALLEDSDGNIWIGTTYGLNRLNPRTNHVQVYPFDARILSLYQDQQGLIWAGTENHGLFFLNNDFGAFEPAMKGETINAMLEDKRNEFWLATANGLVNFDRKTHSYKRFDRVIDSGLARNIDLNQVFDITESPSGDVWLGLSRGRIVKMLANANRDSLKFKGYQLVDNDGVTCLVAASELTIDATGGLWIGTWGEGLFYMAVKEQLKPAAQVSFQVFRNDVNDAFSLEGNNNISALYIDRNGILWVGNSVINLANIKNNRIERYNTRRIVNGNVQNNWVNRFSVDAENKLWIGTSDGLMIYERKAGQALTPYIIGEQLNKKLKNYFENFAVNDILAQHLGYVWLATNSNGLVLIPEGSARKGHLDGILVYNPSNTNNMPTYNLVALAASAQIGNVVWCGSGNEGLLKAELNNGKLVFSQYKAGNHAGALSNNNVRAVYEDTQGRVWVGTRFGLNFFDQKTERFEKYFYSFSDPNSINDHVINCIFEDNTGVIWIGTNKGLNQLEEQGVGLEKKLKFKSFSDQPWISNQIVLNLLEDHRQNLWVGIYNGIVKFNKEKKVVDFSYFDKDYQRVKILAHSSFTDNQGNFLFGGGTGFLRFNPDSIQKAEELNRVELTDLQIFNRKVLPGENVAGKVILNKSITHVDSITLTHKQSVFTFVFSAMNYSSPDRNRYRYLLEGYDKDWNEVGKRNTATYTSVPNGNYVFRVKLVDAPPDTLIPERRLYVKIKPPYYKTYVAYILYAIFVAGLLYFFKQFSIIKHKEKSKLMLEKVQVEKEQELNEMKVSFFTNISHEFRTPLTLIAGPLQELLDNRDKFGTYGKNLELIQRNANRLLRLINQLMEFRKVEKGKMEVMLQELDIIALLNELLDSFVSIARSKKIDISIQYSTPTLHAWVDRDKFDKIIYNLMSNAIKFTDENGQVVIKAGYSLEKANSFYIEFEDNGIGIAPDKQSLVFERFYQVKQRHVQSTGGIGLHMSKAFVELHNGTIELESELGKGSVFKVVLPLNMSGIGEQLTINAQTDCSDNKIPNSPELANENMVSDADLKPVLYNTPDKRTVKPVVLLAEDDPDMNEFISRSLGQHYLVKTVLNGKEALEQARRINPDLLLSDIMMPEMDGLELGRQIRNDITTSHIPILFLTAKTTHDNELEGLLAGANDYICKPFDMNVLRLKIQNILNQRAAFHQYFQKKQILEPENTTLSSLDDEFLVKAVDAVNKNLDDQNFDVEKLSNHIGLSSNQTYRKIKALTGQTAKEFIRNQRLKTAAGLLVQKKRSVSEIIYMVGFTSPSYFTRCFREYYGCTPTEYIDRQASETES